jgi:hypothetical protein
MRKSHNIFTINCCKILIISFWASFIIFYPQFYSVIEYSIVFQLLFGQISVGKVFAALLTRT